MNTSLAKRRMAPLAAAAAAALLIASCGSDDPTDSGSDDSSAAAGDLSGNLQGAGATSQEAAMQAWIAGIQESNPDLTVDYNPVGSGGGRTQFLDGAVAFAGSDGLLKEEDAAKVTERCGDAGAIHLPNYISPIAVAFNLEGVDSLNMKPDVIAGIFSQQIKNWNDPAIAADNPDATLPDLAITPVNRSDESGTTENFTDYLHAVSPTIWTAEADQVWPFPGGEAAQGTSGVVSAITAANGAIGYADASQIGDLGTVAVGVGSEFVELSPEAAAAVVDASPKADEANEYDLAIELARDTTESGAYPVVLVSYHIVCLEYDEQETADNVKGFMSYIVSEDGQTAAAESAGSAPISADLRTQAEASIEQIKVAG